MNPNLINGQKLEIGNPEHIEYYKRQCSIMSGGMPVCEVDWILVKYRGNEESKPLHEYVERYECDSMMFYMECPKCRRLNKMLISGYDPHLHYQSCVEIERGLEEEPFECYNCGLEFTYENDLRQVFVKQ